MSLATLTGAELVRLRGSGDPAGRREVVAELRRREEAYEATLAPEERRQRAIGRRQQDNPLAVIVGPDDGDPQTFVVRHDDFAIPDNAVTVIYGLTTAGKSFLTVDLACSVAAGVEWLGREDGERLGCPIGVLYVQLEGHPAQIANRVDAWSAHHGVDPRPRLTHVRPWGFSWHDPQLVDNLRNLAHDPDVRADLVIIDTLDAGRLSGGNMADDEVGAIFARVLPQLLEWGLTVLVVAHSNAKDESLAGLSRQQNAAEAIIHVRRRGEHRVAVMEKTKDVAGHPEILFDIIDSAHVIEVGPVGVVVPVAETSPKRDASSWLTQQLAGGPASSCDIKAAAAEADIAERTLQRVRTDLGVVVEQVPGSFPRRTTWSLP